MSGERRKAGGQEGGREPGAGVSPASEVLDAEGKPIRPFVITKAQELGIVLQQMPHIQISLLGMGLSARDVMAYH